MSDSRPSRHTEHRQLSTYATLAPHLAGLPHRCPHMGNDRTPVNPYTGDMCLVETSSTDIDDLWPKCRFSTPEDSVYPDGILRLDSDLGSFSARLQNREKRCCFFILIHTNFFTWVMVSFMRAFNYWKQFFWPGRRGMNYLTSLDAWRMDQQRSGNCLATKVTRFITLDFFLWRYVKNLVHKVRNHDLQQLKARIRKAVFTATHNTLQNAWREDSIIWKLIVQPVVPTLNLLG